MVLFRKTANSSELDRVVQLTIIYGNNDTNDLPGKVFNLQCGNNIIGRDVLSDIVLNSGTVSRKHANLKVAYDRRKYSIIDFGSSNGVVIRPDIVLEKGKKNLKSGDEIQIGEIVLKLLALEQDDTLATMTVDAQNAIKNMPKKDPK